MHLRVRFIGKALDYLVAHGHEDRTYSLQVAPEVVHVGDLVRHPLFPGRNVYVVAREVDLIDCCVTVWIDELPGVSVPRELEVGAVRGGGDTAYPVSPAMIDD